MKHLINRCCFRLNEERKLCWMINRSCNLSCRHCAVFDNPFVEQHAPVRSQADIDNVLDAIVEGGIRHVVVSGGEPTLSPWLDAVLQALAAASLSYSLSTNATLIDRSRAHDLAALGLSKTTVSLDGGTIGTHDRLRGQGAFDATLSGVREMRAVGMDVSFGVFARAEALMEVPNILDLAVEHGVNRVALLLPICQGRYRGASTDPDESIVSKVVETALSGSSGFVPEVLVMAPECESDSCPSGSRIVGAIGGTVLPFCIYKGELRSRFELAAAMV